MATSSGENKNLLGRVAKNQVNHFDRRRVGRSGYSGPTAETLCCDPTTSGKSLSVGEPSERREGTPQTNNPKKLSLPGLGTLVNKGRSEAAVVSRTDQ